MIVPMIGPHDGEDAHSFALGIGCAIISMARAQGGDPPGVARRSKVLIAGPCPKHKRGNASQKPSVACQPDIRLRGLIAQQPRFGLALTAALTWGSGPGIIAV